MTKLNKSINDAVNNKKPSHALKRLNRVEKVSVSKNTATKSRRRSRTRRRHKIAPVIQMSMLESQQVFQSEESTLDSQQMSQTEMQLAPRPKPMLQHYELKKSNALHFQDLELQRVQYWYKEEDIALVLSKSLEQKGLQKPLEHKGLILTQAHKLYKIALQQPAFSVSLGEPLVTGGSAAWEGVLIDLLYQTIKATIDWNKKLLHEGVIPEAVKDQVIETHFIAIPYCIDNAHWITLLINFRLEQNGTMFYPAENIAIACLDSMNMSQIDSGIIKNLQAAFVNFVPDTMKINFNFGGFVCKVPRQPDGSSCGVLTTDRIRRFIYGEKLQVLDDGEDVALQPKDIVALREEHMILVDNELFNKKQLGQLTQANITVAEKVQNGDYQHPKKLLDDSADLPQQILNSFEDADNCKEIFDWMQEFVFAFNLLEDLNLPDADINKLSPEYEQLLTKYNDKYELHKNKMRSTNDGDYVETNNEKLSFCADCAVRETLTTLKTWMISQYTALQPIWSSIFTGYADQEDNLSWADNGKDKFADALQCIVAHVNKSLDVTMKQQPAEGYEADTSSVECNDTDLDSTEGCQDDDDYIDVQKILNEPDNVTLDETSNLQFVNESEHPNKPYDQLIDELFENADPVRCCESSPIKYKY